MDEVIRKHGKYPLHSCDAHGLEAEEYRDLRDLLIAGVERRTEVLLDLLGCCIAFVDFLCLFNWLSPNPILLQFLRRFSTFIA